MVSFYGRASLGQNGCAGFDPAQAARTSLPKRDNPEGASLPGCRGVPGWQGTRVPAAHPPFEAVSVQRFFECITEMSAMRPLPWQTRHVSFVPVIAVLRGA